MGFQFQIIHIPLLIIIWKRLSESLKKLKLSAECSFNAQWQF